MVHAALKSGDFLHHMVDAFDQFIAEQNTIVTVYVTVTCVRNWNCVLVHQPSPSTPKQHFWQGSLALEL